MINSIWEAQDAVGKNRERLLELSKAQLEVVTKLVHELPFNFQHEHITALRSATHILDSIVFQGFAIMHQEWLASRPKLAAQPKHNPATDTLTIDDLFS